MKIFKTLFYLSFALLFTLIIGNLIPSYAGGPLFVNASGKPITWTKTEAKGGPLGSTSVNASGQVVYRVDTGPLGPLSNAEGVKIVDRIFKLYTDIPTATIEFVNGGAIRNPNTGEPMDVNSSNVGLVLNDNRPTFQNPIIFDSDGRITGGGGVLGFFFFLNFRPAPTSSDFELTEAYVVLNGASINAAGGRIPFTGVFTHEFGHFAGPLDHSQVNGGIARNSSSATLPDGFGTSEQLFDTFAPFTETVYPFLFGGPSSSKLGNLGLRSSGSFIASLAFDDILAMSNLYPAPGYLPTEPGSQVGGITGKIIIRSPNSTFPISGLNVVARRISLGKYPPDPTTDVFRGNAPTDSDGVPLPPPARAELDSLATATSYVSGVLKNDGSYQFLGLPPGDYLISVEKIDPNSVGGSSIGQRADQLIFTGEENYNGVNEGNTNDNPRDFSPVKVVAGSVTPNIDIILNGFGLNTVNSGNEVEPNDKKNQAQRLTLDSKISGRISIVDPSKITIDFGQDSTEGIKDLYRVDLKTASELFISLEANNIRSDVDLFVFAKGIKNGTISADSSLILTGSTTETGSESVGTGILAPGTYYIGVGVFGSDTDNYTLSIFSKK